MMGMKKPMQPRILIIGTGDTKADELEFMQAKVTEAGGLPLMLDVSVLGDPPYAPDFDKHAVAAEGGSTIAAIVELGDENSAMTVMAAGASALTKRLHDEGRIDGVIALGGTMGTDLALDVALALPLGVPKFVVSTISYSHLIPPERITMRKTFGVLPLARHVEIEAAGHVPNLERPSQFNAEVLHFLRDLSLKY